MSDKRLPYRLGDRMPKLLRIPYYIILWATTVYALYRFTRWILESIQKLGTFVFDKRNYWTVILSIGILLLGSFLISQFWLGLDPAGKAVESIKAWIESVNKAWGN